MAKARQRQHCTAHTSSGAPCRNWAIEGGTVCRYHGGATPNVRRRAEIRVAVRNWGLGDVDIDPAQTLLRLVAQSATRVERYSALLEQAYEAAERLRSAVKAQQLLADVEPSGEVDDHGNLVESAALQQARQDLADILSQGGVTALVGKTWADTKQGEIYATGEAVRGLAALERDERKLCADLCAKAIAAGIAERQVRIAEQQGRMLADLIGAVLRDPALALRPEQRKAVPAVVRAHLAAVTG